MYSPRDTLTKIYSGRGTFQRFFDTYDEEDSSKRETYIEKKRDDKRTSGGRRKMYTEGRWRGSGLSCVWPAVPSSWSPSSCGGARKPARRFLAHARRDAIAANPRAAPTLRTPRPEKCQGRISKAATTDHVLRLPVTSIVFPTCQGFSMVSRVCSVLYSLMWILVAKSVITVRTVHILPFAHFLMVRGFSWRIQATFPWESPCSML